MTAQQRVKALALVLIMLLDDFGNIGNADIDLGNIDNWQLVMLTLVIGGNW